jgi:murein DD-endopeptidase MepM/ murein hydrolase activator NlpD
MKNNCKIIITIFIFSLFVFKTPEAISGYEDDINEQIKLLSDQISNNKKKIEDVQNRQKEYLNLIDQKQSEQSTLGSELEILSDRVAKAQLEIDENQLEIDKTNLEIKKTTIEIQTKDEEIAKEKEHIASLLRLIYKQDQISTLEILLLNDSLADFISQVKYLENTNDEIIKSVGNLELAKNKLEQNKSTLLEKQTELTKLEKALEEKRIALQGDQEVKSIVLEESQQSEKRYQYLLQQARKEQAQASAEISSLEKTVRQKLASIKDKPTLKYDGFAWPVKQNTVTATFHDPDYPFKRLIGEHSGIDIRSAYGSSLKAAADGYVARVKFDGSKSYAYIMIIHADGLSTVYGHVSGVSVKADDYVVQGQVIGKTGGLPGSPGSGPFCTGAHLHFEVRKDGIPVNPLSYLP